MKQRRRKKQKQQAFAFNCAPVFAPDVLALARRHALNAALRYEGDATMRVELDLEPAATVNVAQDVLDTVSECLLATSSVVAGRVRAMVEGDMPATEEQRQLAAAFLLDLARDDVAL
jgi:hypothetical protein